MTESNVGLIASAISRDPAGIIAGQLEVPPAGDGGPVPVLSISSIVVTAGSVQLTWNSRPGETYAVEQSKDLVNFEVSVRDIESAGSTTVANFERSDANSIFYRVRKEP